MHSYRPVQVTVAKGSTGSVVKYPKVLAGWKVPANMAGEVILARLVLVGSKRAQKEGAGRSADYSAIEHAGVLAEQLYTFGVLAAGSNVNRPVNAVKPMAPLLHAPAAACTVSVPACTEAERRGRGKQHTQSDDGGTAVVTDDDTVVCSVTVSNTGSVPCLYVKLELRDQTIVSSSGSTNSSSSTTAAAPQFHAADFSTNYVTVFGQSSVDVTFERLPYHDASEISSWTASLNV